MVATTGKSTCVFRASCCGSCGSGSCVQRAFRTASGRNSLRRDHGPQRGHPNPNPHRPRQRQRRLSFSSLFGAVRRAGRAGLRDGVRTVKHARPPSRSPARREPVAAMAPRASRYGLAVVKATLRHVYGADPICPSPACWRCASRPSEPQPIESFGPHSKPWSRSSMVERGGSG